MRKDITERFPPPLQSLNMYKTGLKNHERKTDRQIDRYRSWNNEFLRCRLAKRKGGRHSEFRRSAHYAFRSGVLQRRMDSRQRRRESVRISNSPILNAEELYKSLEDHVLLIEM